MSSGSAATSTPKYMQNCDTYLRRRSFWRTKKNRPPKKIGKSGQSEKYSGSFVVFERGVNFRCFSDLLSKKKKTPKQASNGIWSLDVLLFLSRWISDIEESKNMQLTAALASFHVSHRTLEQDMKNTWFPHCRVCRGYQWPISLSKPFWKEQQAFSLPKPSLKKKSTHPVIPVLFCFWQGCWAFSL